MAVERLDVYAEVLPDGRIQITGPPGLTFVPLGLDCHILHRYEDPRDPDCWRGKVGLGASVLVYTTDEFIAQVDCLGRVLWPSREVVEATTEVAA